ncbi:60S acidic ribosomal protein P1 [Armadillidium vulgare]|nr:60S acidic ribosomal protein P1 [Armadillidium vulgare]
MTSKDELACVYAALILLDDDVPITAEKISTILKAANVNVEPYWPGLFAKAAAGLDLRALVSNVWKWCRNLVDQLLLPLPVVVVEVVLQQLQLLKKLPRKKKRRKSPKRSQMMTWALVSLIKRTQRT